MKKVLVLIAFILMILQSFSHGNDRLDEEFKKHPIQKIEVTKEAEIKDVLGRNKIRIKGPQKCPLSIKNANSTLLKLNVKINKLKELCLNNGDEESLDFENMLMSAEALDSLGANFGDTPMMVSMGQIGGMLSSLNSLSKKSCAKKRVGLNVMLSIFQQIVGFSGLLPPEYGAAIGGASAGISATLAIVKGFLDQQYNFTDIKQRNDFINLNCQFYELRQELNASGLLSIPTPHMRADYVLVGGLIYYLSDLKLKNKLEMKTIQDNLKGSLETDYSAKISIAQELRLALMAQLPQLKTSLMDGEYPPKTMKLKFLQGLALAAPNISTLLKGHIDAGYSGFPLFDQMFIAELAKLDFQADMVGFSALLAMDPFDFDSDYRANLLFHFERVIADINIMRLDVRGNWEGDLGGNLDADLKLRNKKYLRYNKYLDGRISLLSKLQSALKASFDVDGMNFGNSHLIEVISNFNCLKSNMAAEGAFKFLDFVTMAAKLKYKLFDLNFNWMEKNALKLNEASGKYELSLNPADINTFTRMNTCQRAIDSRNNWIEATGNTDQAVGYVKSIEDLLVIPDKTLYKKTPEHERNDFLITKGEKLRRHQHSILYAEKMMKGEKVEEKYTKRVVAKNYAGKLMMDRHERQNKIEATQMLIDKLGCDNLGEEINIGGETDISDIDVNLDNIEISDEETIDYGLSF